MKAVKAIKLNSEKIRIILSEAKKPVSKSTLIHKTGLNGIDFRKYREFLVGQDYLSEIENPNYRNCLKKQKHAYSLNFVRPKNNSEIRFRGNMRFMYITTDDGRQFLGEMEDMLAVNPRTNTNFYDENGKILL
jgi:hypothetical protein